MAHKELEKYVKEQLQHGRTKQDIQDEVLASGWHAQDVEKVFQQISHNAGASHTPPKPPYATIIKKGKQMLHPKAHMLFYSGSLIAGAVIIVLVVCWEIFVHLISSPALSENNDIETFRTGMLIMGAVMIVGVLIWMVVAYFWTRWQYNAYRYELTEEGFKKEYGVISKGYVTIPYGRIQNVDITRGIMDRFFGLSTIRIQTAGSTRINAEGLLRGLDQQTAEDLRNELIHLSIQSRDEI